MASPMGRSPRGEDVESLEMAPHALGEAVARDPVQALGVADRVVDRRRPQRAGVTQEALRIAGRNVTVAAADRKSVV